MAHRLCIHAHTFHSVIIDAAAATDVSSNRVALLSDQLHTIWSRISRQLEVINVAVGLWRSYRTQLVTLRSLLTQIGEVIRADCRREVVSLPVQRAPTTRLQVKMGWLVTVVMS